MDVDDFSAFHSQYPDYSSTIRPGRPIDVSQYFEEFWDNDSTQKVCALVEFLMRYDDTAEDECLHYFTEMKEEQQPNFPNMTYHYTLFLQHLTPSLEARGMQLHDGRVTFWQCVRARCKFCGFVRAKNSTRQFEHVQQCADFLNSTEGQQAVGMGLLNMPPPDEPDYHANIASGEVFKGRAPNPIFKGSGGRPRQSGTNITPARPGPPLKPAPSLVNHLLAKNRVALDKATQLQFLSHAGCGTLSSAALDQWLAQQGHLSRHLCTFIGSLIGKLRLPNSRDPNSDTSWRALDLLVAAMKNARLELDFLRNTHLKYNLQHDDDPAKPATKGFIDMFNSVTSPAASLLEGLVVLWAIEHLNNISWQYAANFVQQSAPASTSYTVPSYLQPGEYDSGNPYGQPATHGGSDSNYTAALHEALIPNWTSNGFAKFVDACKSIVDELANSQTTGDGKTELENCIANFTQAIWLWKQVFPEVTGMGEEEDVSMDTEGQTHANGSGERAEGPIEIPDDEDERDEDAPTADSPYAGTGLGVVAAANSSA